MQSHPHQVIGYHSCDKDIGLRIISGEIELKESKNAWDWLGHGTYFWEDNPFRALEYAEEVRDRKQFNSGKIKIPFVIGAILELGNCLNLLAPSGTEVLRTTHESLKALVKVAGQKMPVNKKDNRALDCSVIRLAANTNKYDTVRTAFDEGEKIYAGTNFTARHHMQICVINQGCIKGFFLPRPLKTFNPHCFL